MNLEIALNNAFHANEFNGFEGYDKQPVMLESEEFDMDLSWVDDSEYYHDGLERSCDEPYEPDAFADAEALASAGWGTDEDYGYYGE